MHEPGCSEEHEDLRKGQERISKKVDHLQSAVEYHIGQTHEELRREEDENTKQLYAIVNALADKQLGPIKEPESLYGGARDEKAGTAYKVEQMWAASQNGGFKLKIPWTFWAAITAALIAGVFDVVHALIGG